MIINNLYSIWFMNGVRECAAMKELLENHKFFCNYKIILATGEGEGSSDTALESFKAEIARGKGKIICLSCGMLNTGVTIKELNSVCVLSTCNSAQTYMQSIFRCQSPYKVNREIRKTECYSFDFDPYRVLKNIENFVSKQDRTPQEKVREVQELLLSINLFQDGEMHSVDYKDYLEYLSLDFSEKEVHKRVRKINNLSVDLCFSLPTEILDIIDSLPLFRYSKEDKREEKHGESKSSGKKSESRPKDSEFDKRRQKLNCFISSLLEFMYISNYAEEKIDDFINSQYPELFKRVCVISLEEFNKLLNNKVFRDEILNRTIRTFKNYESSSRAVGQVEI
jgi:type I site-specific restriction endonuclease